MLYDRSELFEELKSFSSILHHLMFREKPDNMTLLFQENPYQTQIKIVGQEGFSITTFLFDKETNKLIYHDIYYENFI